MLVCVLLSIHLFHSFDSCTKNNLATNNRLVKVLNPVLEDLTSAVGLYVLNSASDDDKLKM